MGGIMAFGKLRCVGTPLHLKKKFGSGYQLTVTTNENTGPVKSFIKRLIPSAGLTEEFFGLMRFILPREDVLVSQLFKVMEGEKKKYGIAEWSFSETSLEEVF